MTKRTELSQIGEFGLIDHLQKLLNYTHKNTHIGIGDDGAAMTIPPEEKMVITTDLLVEGTHFNLMYTPLKHLGYKAVVVNISDLLAMNAKPAHITVSVALSNRFSLESVEELYKGIELASQKYGVDVVGGDITSSHSGLLISVTAVGSAPEKQIVRRSAAKENQIICVSGNLGAAYLGLQVLEREKEVFKSSKMQPDLASYDYIIGRQLKPEARKEIIALFKEKNILPTSLIDISDGLASELMHICKQSQCGAQIYEDKLPIDIQTYNTAQEMNLSATTCALNGGEDYELLFTIEQNDYEKLKGVAGIATIGHITDKNAGLQMVCKDQTLIPLSAQGWDGLKQNTK